MTALLERIDRTVNRSCIAKRGLKKDGCGIVMTGAPKPRIVIDFDKPGSPLPQNAKRCDYLVIAKGEDAFTWVAALELKRGGLDASNVVSQLQAGAAAAEKIVPESAVVKFRPIVACGSQSRHQWPELRKKANRIRFHQQNEYVRVMTCGEPLTKSLC